MKSVVAIYSVLVLLAGQVCSQSPKGQEKIVGGKCDACELMFEGMPNNPGWKTRLSSPGEAGDPLIISGTIFQSDGKTPAPDVILYVYHTDATGRYTPSSKQTAGKRHGRLRGWMKTGTDGRYQFETIRPASYPDSRTPQHVHPIIKEPKTSLYWIDEYLFEDDPFLGAKERAQQEKRGGTGIIQLKRNGNGTWAGHRDIILGLNIPNYHQ